MVTMPAHTIIQVCEVPLYFALICYMNVGVRIFQPEQNIPKLPLWLINFLEAQQDLRLFLILWGTIIRLQ